MVDWNIKAKRLLKSELIKRGISTSDLTQLLNDAGIQETKSSIDSKICRGKFSASFFLQCLNVIGCTTINIEIEAFEVTSNSIVEYSDKNYR